MTDPNMCPGSMRNWTQNVLSGERYCTGCGEYETVLVADERFRGLHRVPVHADASKFAVKA